MLRVLTRLADAPLFTDPQIDTWADGGTHICLQHNLKRGFLVTTAMAETLHYGLNVPLPRFQCWHHHLQCDDISRQHLWDVISVRWGHDRGFLVIGLVTSWKKTPESLLSLQLLCEVTVKQRLSTCQEGVLVWVFLLMLPDIDTALAGFTADSVLSTQRVHFVPCVPLLSEKQQLRPESFDSDLRLPHVMNCNVSINNNYGEQRI